MKFPHRKVSKHAAMNPVARALAWRDLQRYAVDAKIKLYVMDEGEDCEDWAMPIARFLTMVQVGLEHDGRVQEFLTEVAIISTGVRAITIMSQHGWKFLQGWIPQLDDAITTAVQLTPKLTPQAVNHAWRSTH